MIGAGRPELTPEAVAEGIAALDAAELLEDAAAATSLTERERERYQSNLRFLRHVCRLRAQPLLVPGAASSIDTFSFSA